MGELLEVSLAPEVLGSTVVYVPLHTDGVGGGA